MATVEIPFSTTIIIETDYPEDVDKEQELLFAEQRVNRHYDDTAFWSMDMWLSELAPKIIRDIKSDKYGIPGVLFPENSFHPTEEEIKAAKQKWSSILDEIILGFESALKITEMNYDWKNPAEKDELMNNFNRGMDLFKQYYFNLWT